MNYLNINLGAFGIIALILAIIATVAAFILVVPESKREKLGRFGKFLHDAFNFKFLIVEKVLQALYIFFTAYVILCGFFMLFMAPETWYGGRQWLGGYGLLLMILGPIVIRLSYELLMMSILLVKNVISINRKLKNQNEHSADADLFTVPEYRTQPAKPAAPVAPVAPAAPAQPETPAQPVAPSFCTRCGAHLDENGHCPNCDQE